MDYGFERERTESSRGASERIKQAYLWSDKLIYLLSVDRHARIYSLPPSPARGLTILATLLAWQLKSTWRRNVSRPFSFSLCFVSFPRPLYFENWETMKTTSDSSQFGLMRDAFSIFSQFLPQFAVRKNKFRAWEAQREQVPEILHARIYRGTTTPAYPRVSRTWKLHLNVKRLTTCVG